MRHRLKTTKLGRNTNQRQALYKQLAGSLVLNEKIKTTITKAKVLSAIMDKLMTKAKKGTLSARRDLLAFFPQKSIAHKLFDVLAPRTKKRTSGFTRIVRLGRRRGDQAMIAQIEFMDKKEEVKEVVKKEAVKK